MSTDFRTYFDNKLKQEIALDAQLGYSSKYQDLQRATADKIQLLDRGIIQAKQRELAEANSWVGSLGLDPNSTLGTLANLHASFSAGMSRTAGYLARFATADLEAMLNDSAISEPQKQALGRHLQGAATAEDTALLNQKDPIGGGFEGLQPSALERFEAATQARIRGDKITQAFDRNDLVHQGRRDGLREQLGENFESAWDQTKTGAKALWSGEGEGRVSGAGDLATGLGRLIYNAGEAAVTNPGAASEYIAENIPQLALGALGQAGKVGLVASNVGYASEYYQKGIAKYQSENQGAYPPEAQRMEMAAYAASLALAEQVSDTTLLKGALGAGKAAKAGTEVVEDTVRTGFKQSLLNIAKATGTGVATETATEGWQTFAEGEASLTPATAEQIYEGAAIGGIVGGGLSGGGRVLGEVFKATPEHAAKAANEYANQKAKDDVQAAAIATGDVSALVDPKKSTYDPARAVAALAGNSALPETTEEARQANLVKAGEIVAGLEELAGALQESYRQATPEGIAELKTQLAEAEAKGKAEYAAAIRADLEAAEETPANELRSLKARADRLSASLAQAKENLTRFTSEVAGVEQGTDVDGLIASINTPIDDTDATAVQARSQAVDKVINLSMAARETLSPTVAAKLAEDTENGLTESQRTYLREFSAARVAENAAKTMDKVQMEVLVGGKGYVGLAEHRQDITGALASGNAKRTDRLIERLEAFALDHQAKAATAVDAWAKGPSTQIVKTSTGWAINHGPRLSDPAIKKNGGLTLNTEKLPLAIQAEAAAITSALKELKAARALKFKTTKEEKVDVQNVPQAHDAAKDAGVGKQEVQAGAVAQEAAPAGAGASDPHPGGQPTSVEPTRVVPKKVRRKLTPLEKAHRQLTREKNKIVRGSASLYSALKGALRPQDLTDVYGTEWKKRYTRLRGEGHLVDLVTSGTLDDFLPPNLRLGNVQDRDLGQEQEAEEFIKEKLRNRDYLTWEAQEALHQVGMTLAQLEQQISEEEQDAEIEQAERELSEARSTNEQSSGQSASKAAPESASGNSARTEGSSGRQGLTQGTAASVPRPGTQSTEVESTGVTPSSTQSDQSTESTASRAEGQIQSTDSVSQSTESAELSNPSESSEKTSEDQSTESEAVEAGRLSLFEAKEEDNPIATGFVQEAARESDSTKRPLVAVKDFIGSLKERAQEFVTDRLDENQNKALATFVQAAKVWAGTIKANLPARKDAKYRFEDVMQYLLNEAGDVDENVKTAISYAAFTWAADQASAPVNQDKKAVNKILGLQKDAWAGYEAYDLLGPAGTYQHLLMDSLGGTVMDALGLRNLPDTPQDQVSKLRAALGAHALKLMEDRGMVQRTMIGADVIARLRQQEISEADIAYKDKTGKPVYVPHYFIAVARDEEGKPVKAVEAARQATKDSKGVLEKLFKVTPHARAPSLVPITTLPETTKGTQMKVPEELKAVLLANQARPRKVRKDTVSLLGQFSEEAINYLIGVITEEDLSTHLVNRRGIEAKNAGLKREYSQFIDWIGEYLGTSKDGLDTPFYYEFMPWKQQRVGIATTVGNPQTSKIARFMVASPEWTTEIDSTDERLMTSFWLRVGEGLGVKTERADNDVSVAAITTMVTDPIYVAAIQALRKDGELTPEEQEAVVAGVVKGGANLHTLDVLMGVAQQQNAEAAADGGPYTFTVQMMGEVDGVANGTMLNHVLMGAGNSAEELQGMLTAGGFYEVGSEHTQYNQWRGAPGNLDIYETTARWLDEQVRADFPLRRAGNLAAPLVGSIWAIAGEVFDASKGTVTTDGRNLVKDALNPLAFGSSMSAVVRGMSEAFLVNVYKKFEKLSNEGATQAEVDALVGHMNRLLEGKKVKPLPLGRSIQEWMNTPLSSAEEAGLMKAFADTVGKSTVKVLERRFAPFLARRDALNKTANVTFGLSDAIYRGTREAYIETLIAAGKIKLDAKGNRIGDLSKKQEAQLARWMRFVDPLVQTAMSGKDRASGLRMAKVKRKQNKAPEYANKTQFGTQIGNLLAGNGKPMKSIVVHGFSSQQEEPGVAMGSALTHSFDSSVSHRTQAVMDVLNVHDAVGAGVGGLEAAARLMNQNTWKGALEYSPMEAAYQSLATVVRNLASMQEKGALSPQALFYVQEFLEEQAEKEKLPVGDLIGYWMTDAKRIAYRADQVKLQVLSNLASVDQYAYQGGNYVVTDADRAQAEKQLNGLEEKLSEKDLAAVKALANIMDAKPEAAQATPVAQAAEGESVEAVVDGNTEEGGELDLDMDLPPWEESAPKSSPFGNLGTPATVDASLVEFFKQSPEPSMKAVLRQLYKSIKAKGDGRINAFQLELVQQIYKSIPTNVKVRLITPETKPGDVMAMPKGVVRGWFVAEKGKAEVYVLSQDFLYSGLNSTETLLHELVHATVGLIADNPDSESAPLVAELEALLEKARQHPNAAKHQEALVNVQELIAWGMTNDEFQRDVLEQVTMETTTSENALVSGFKAFIDTLVGILFKGSTKSTQARAVNGMTLLIKNVAGLMNVANQERLMSGELNLSQAINSFTTLDIHNALNGDGLSSEFDSKLKGLLQDIVRKLHGPFGAFKADVLQRTSAAATPEAVWEKARDTGVAPLALSVRASPLLVSEKELHAMEQVEATVRAALDSSETSARTAYKELEALFLEMRAKIKPSDFKGAKDWDFIFKVENKADGRSDYLARFAAFALAHQEFNGLMQQNTKADTRRVGDARTIGERVQLVFEKILAFFAEKVTHTYAGQRADRKLELLVEQLVDIEAKKKLALAKAAQPKGVSPLATAEKLAEGMVDVAKEAVLKAANVDFVKNSKNVFVRFGARMVRLQANDQVEYFMNELSQFRDQYFPGLHGLPTQVLNQVKGAGQILNLLQLMSTNSQRQRKQIITQTAKAVSSVFKQKLDKATKAAITQVFMRTGMHTLLDQFSMLDIEQMMADRKKLVQAIALTEAEFQDTAELRPFMEHFIIQANALGYFRATGKVKHQKLMMNAHNISRLFGTGHTAKLTVEQSKIAEPIIERLVALYAMEYSKPAAVAQAKEVLATENAREEGESNGVEFVLRLHRALEQKSADRLFRNQPALMMHGYTPEITNPGTVVAAANEVDGLELIAQGYTKGEPLLSQDPAHPNPEVKHLYVLRDGGLARFQTGIVSNSGKQAKGSKQHSGFLNVNTADGLENASWNADVAAAKPGGLSRGQRPDLSKEKQTYMAPVVNPQGEVVNWRYLMSDDTKDAVLERDNRFDTVMGVLAGSIFDKEDTNVVNGKTFAALKDIFVEGQYKQPEAFVLVGPKSPDAKLREIWSMLPDEAKIQVRNSFGRDGLYVRKDMLLPVFGYRTYSLSEAFKKDPDARTIAEKFMVDFIEWLVTMHAQVKARTQGVAMNYDDARKMAKKAAVLIARGEKGWQELVHEIKDIIVVKSIKVLIDNVLSNWSQLLLAGVSIKDILHHHLVALRAARAYEKASEELGQLQVKVDAGMAPKGAEQEIARLKDALARNPVRDLIEAGLMPTIVEDVAADDETDLYSYKSQLMRKTEAFTKKLNPTVVNVAKNIYMAHDTKIYQGLSRVTRLSDFVARYTLYQHLTNTKGVDGTVMTKEEAIHEASEAFVNYDSPLPKGLQYLDTMGIVPFTKYYLRIQRVLLRLARKNPARVIGTLLLNNFVDLGPIVLESSWISKVGNNPFQWGALQLPGTVDDLGTIAAATALVR